MTEQAYDPTVYVALKESGKSNRQIARTLGVDEATVRRGLKSVGWGPHMVPQQMVLDAVVLPTPLEHDVREDGGIAISADWHHPLADYALVNQFLTHAKDARIKTLAIIGDWFNQDALSDFARKQDTDAGLEKEIAFSRVAMEKVLETFDKVYFTWGNHDSRFWKRLEYRLQFESAMRLLFADLGEELIKRIQFSSLDHMLVHGTQQGEGTWYLCHPKSYSQAPLNTGRRLASKFLANIGVGHSHHTAIGSDVSSRYVVLELGGFFDRHKFEYLQRTTTFPNWQKGYAMLRDDGWLELEAEGWSLGRKR